jgi:hypothetical protein
VSIPQHPTHKRPEAMPVMDKLGSRTLDDFRFIGHSKGCSLNPAKVDKVLVLRAKSWEYWDRGMD